MLKIVSGGQTGADRAALDAALKEGAPAGGWCPAGRRAEDGVIPEKYPLREMPGPGYGQRTRQNVIDSDGTVIFYFGSISGGSETTRRLCVSMQKPFLLMDAATTAVDLAINRLGKFIDDNAINVLNVAGSRASNAPALYSYVLGVVGGLIQSIR